MAVLLKTYYGCPIKKYLRQAGLVKFINTYSKPK